MSQVDNTRVSHLVMSLIFLWCVAIGPVHAQSRGDEPQACANYPRGGFRQITGASLDLSPLYVDTLWLNKESDLRDNRWTLDPLDEVDAAYKFLIVPLEKPTMHCASTINVAGKLMSPSGKLFDFQKATYDFQKRSFSIKTTERDGIAYEAEVYFHDSPVLVDGIYRSGTVKLKGFGKPLGTVFIHFPFAKIGRG